MSSLIQSNQEVAVDRGRRAARRKPAKARAAQSKPNPGERDARPGERAMGAEADCLSRLTSLIEGEIVPRLMLVHRVADAAPIRPAAAQCPIAQAEIDKIARLAMSNDLDSLLADMKAHLAAGAAMDGVLGDLVGGAARRLGAWWEEDRCSFVDVTIGLGALHRLVHDIARHLPPAEATPGLGALFATLPGEQHSLGVRVIDESFRAAGWRTQCEVGLERGALLRLVKARWFDLFGLSLVCEADLEPAAALIRGVRRAAMNAGICVIVGGRIPIGRDDLIKRTGADISAARGSEAVEIAHRAVLAAAGAEGSLR